MELELIFEKSNPGISCSYVGPAEIGDGEEAPEEFRRTSALLLPEVAEPVAVRHYTQLSQLNYSVDTTFYPLGSCTMKYNPKVNDRIAGMPGLSRLHPCQPDGTVQGMLHLLYTVERWLCEIAGLSRASLQPAAGAQGEFAGMLMVRAYHRDRGDLRRTRILVPDTAHGTNPASAARCGFSVLQLHSGPDGCVDLGTLRQALTDEVAAVMLTIPNTLGIFEREICAIAEMAHEAGALLYFDGANMNALLGRARPGDMGCDVMHFNLHKTFSTPHGGGGPGSGPVAVGSALEPFLPLPVLEHRDGRFFWDWDRPRSIGRLHAFHGNAGVVARAFGYLKRLGGNGLASVTDDAVLNANYLKSLLPSDLPVAHAGLCKHEFVATAAMLKEETGVRAWDVAKRLLDFGCYAPTIYFPLNVPEALMVEPTETESKRTLEQFASVLVSIVAEARRDPDKVLNAPWTTPVRRLDEAEAARHPNLRWEGDFPGPSPG